MTDEELDALAENLRDAEPGIASFVVEEVRWLVQRAKDANRLEREARYREAMQDKVAAAMQRDRERLLRDE